MASQRELSLVVKVINQASAEIAKIRADLASAAAPQGNQQTVPGQIADDAKEASAEIIRLAKAMGTTYAEAEKLSKELGLSGDKVAQALSKIKEFQSVKLDADKQFQVLNQSLGVTQQQFQRLSQVASTGLGGVQQQAGGLGGLIQGLIGGGGGALSGVTGLAFSFNQVTAAVGAVISGIQQLAALATPAFNALVLSNERLNAQLLGSQTNLASATRLFRNGVEITDPTAKINASRKELEAALKQVEKDTQNLVGVTSQQVNELFQITLTNAADLNKQSKEFPGPIQAATQLTKGWAASLKVIGIPLDQSRQEINSILKGQVDNNSILAKNLNITNDQVKTWKSQGRLVDELNKRLETFVAGNAIAANSIDGIGSNIQDIFEVVAREAGKPLLEPIIGGLNEVYKYLNTNRDAIQNYFSGIFAYVAKAGADIGQALAPVADAFLRVIAALGPGVQSILELILGLVKNIFRSVSPVLTIILRLLEPVAQALSGVFQILNAIFQVADRALEPVRDFIDAIVAGAFQIIDSLSPAKILGGLVDGFKIAAGAISTILAAIAQQVQGPFNTVLTFIQGVVGQIADIFIKSPVGELLTGISSKIQQGLSTLVGAYKSAVDQIVAYIANTPLGKLLGGAGDIVNNAKNAVAGAIGGAKDAVTNLFGGEQKPEEKKPTDTGTGDLEIRAKELERLGTQAEQLRKQLSDTENAIATEGGGDSGRFQKAAQDRIKSLQQAAETGIITREAAAEQLNLIASNAKVEVATQQSAQDAITKIKKSAIDEQNKLYDSQIATIEAAVAAGIKKEADGAAEIAKIRQQRAEGNLEATRAQILAEQNAINEGRGSKQRLAELTAEEKKQQAEREKTIAEGEKNVQEARTKEIEKASAKQQASIKKASTEEEIALQEKLQAGTLSQSEAAAESAKIQEESASKELKIRKEALDKIEALPKASNPKAEEERQKQILSAQQAYGDARLKQIKAQVDKEKSILQSRIDAIDRAEAKANDKSKIAQNGRDSELQRQLNEGLITREQFAIKRIESAQKAGAAELAAEKKSLEALENLPKPKNKDEAEKLEKKILESRKRIGELNLQQLQQQAEREKAIQEARFKEIERVQSKANDKAKLAETQKNAEIQKQLNEGKITAEEAASARVAATEKATAAQLKAELEALKKLEALPKPKNKELAEAQEKKVTEARKRTAELQVQILQQQADKEKSVLDARLSRIQKAEDKALATIKESETKRSIETQKLINAGLLTQEEANQKRLQSTRQSIEAELAAEKQKLAELEKIPAPKTAQAREELEKRLQAQRQKTGDLTLKLLENEKSQQEVLTAVIQKKIDRELQGFKNAVEASNQALNKQLQLQESLTKAVEQRQNLLQAQLELQQSLAESTQAQYSAAISLLESQFSAEDALKAKQEKRAELQKRLGEAKSPEDRQAIQKELADLDKQEQRERQLRDLKIEAKNAELEQLRVQNTLSEENLKLEQAKTQLLREQEQSRLNMQAAEAKAGTAQAQADLAKTRADRNATPEQIRAAELQVEAAKTRETETARQQQFLDQRAKTEESIFAAQRENQKRQQQIQIDQKRQELAQLTPDAQDDQALQKEQLAKARGSRTESARIGQLAPEEALASQQKDAGAVQQRSALIEQIKSQMVPLTPGVVQQTQSPELGQVNQALSQLTTQLQSLESTYKTQGQTPQQVQVNQNISGQIDPNKAAELASRKTVQALTRSLEVAGRK